MDLKTKAMAVGCILAPGLMEHRFQQRVRPDIAARLDAQKVIFIHIPKTGGVSVSTAAFGGSPGHRTWHQWQRLHPKKFGNYLKFAVIRDPISRFLSAYDYILNRPIGWSQLSDTWIDAVRSCGDIETLLKQLAEADWSRFPHFRPQSHFVATSDRTIMVNRIVPFTRIETEIENILGIKIKRLNPTRGDRTSAAELHPNDLKLLQNFYCDDSLLHEFALSAEGDVFGRRFG
jgi:Sulfotransferase family